MPKVNRKLTEAEIRNAKPKDEKYRLYDEGGLYLLVRPSGTKVWRLPYRFNGKYNTYTIGQYGSTADKVGSIEARKQRDEIKALLQQGIDPNTQRKTEYQRNVAESSNTFESVALDWYSKQTWTPKHAKNIKSRLQKDVFNVIGWKPIAEVNVPDTMGILKQIEKRNAPNVAQRINQYCSAIFDHAIVQGLCEVNPAHGRAKFVQTKPVQNRQHLKEKQLTEFLQRLDDPTKYSTMQLAVKLLTLTFLRPIEVRGAKWSEVDEKEKLWTIPAERMKHKKEHLVPLSRQVLAVLAEIRKFTGNSEWVLPGRSGTKSISDVVLINYVKEFSDNKATPHGFRHTASTILNEKGFNYDHIEKQLAHVHKSKVRATYNKAIYLEDRKKMMQWWADFLDKKRKSSEG